ncbi:MAG: nitroreductase family protein [Dehalococcoidia bacterium]
MPDILPALARRRALRAVDPRPVSPEHEALLWTAASVAPSHGNSQTTRLLMARSPETRAALVAALSEGNRSWAPNAPLLVGVAAMPGHASPQVNSDGSERDLWAFQAGIVAAHIMAQATELGLIAHPMAGFDEVAGRRAFGGPEDLRILVVLAIGYPGDPASLPDDLQKRETIPQERIPLANLLVEDRWTDEHGVSARDLRRAARG